VANLRRIIRGYRAGARVTAGVLAGAARRPRQPQGSDLLHDPVASLLPTRFGIGFASAVLAVVAVIVCTWYVLLALVFSRPVVQRGYRRVGRTVNRVAAGAIGVLGLRLVLDA
jgi:hypothetical protein